MSNVIVRIAEPIYEVLRRHLFQSEIEQGAFLMTSTSAEGTDLIVHALDYHLVPPEGWIAQLDVYLEMTDEERGKIMQKARKRNCGVIDIHSHPGSGGDVWFSPSDIAGIKDFAEYSKWKLPGQPYIAMVWGEQSLDAVVWQGEFVGPETVKQIEIRSDAGILTTFTPVGSWFSEWRGYNRKHCSRSRRKHV